MRTPIADARSSASREITSGQKQLNAILAVQRPPILLRADLLDEPDIRS
jgi:hypothetical protein